MNTFNKLKAVIGLAFGDEGKGNTVAYLTNQEQQSGKSVLVVRFSGSSQATHTAQVDGVRHSFAHFGAGTLTGAHTFWSKFCPFEPLTFYHEYQKLLNMPSVPPIKFFADPLCPVVTPFDILANQYGQANLKHGTTGQGHGTTMQRQEDHYKLHLIDLTSEAVWLLKFENIKKYYQAKYPSINFGNPLELFRQRIAELFDIIEIMPLSAITRKYDSVICEGSQGILLDQDYGFFPHVTRSYTTHVTLNN